MIQPGNLKNLYSHHIIGAVAEALNLGQGVLSDRTAKRFYAGESVSEYSRDQLLEEFGRALVGIGLVPEPPFLRQHGLSMPELVTAAVTSAASQWDGLMSTVQSESTPYFDIGVAASEFLRLVAIDLSLRVGAAYRLAGFELSPDEIPSWALENGLGTLLRELTQEAGITRDQLAARAGVSYTTIDNLLDGKYRPSPQRVTTLARAFAPDTNESEVQRVAKVIQRQLALSHLATLLSDLIGRARVVELATAIFRFAWFIDSDLERMNRPPVGEDATLELDALRFGFAGAASRALLHSLAYAQPDERWRKDILAASVNWSVSFQQIAYKASGQRSASGLSQDVSDICTDSEESLGKSGSSSHEDPTEKEIQNRLSQSASDAMNSFIALTQVRDGSPNAQDVNHGMLDTISRMLNTGIAERRSLVDKFPDSPQAHFELGSFLGMVGKNLSRRDLVDEGILECRISVGLLPGWDGPAVEPGIMLINIGEYQEAIQELIKAERTLGQATSHLSFAMGYALMMLSRYVEALERLERVVADQPNYALANLYAARCSFYIGDKTKGIRYAKTGRRLGEPSEFNAWREGAYATSKPATSKD